MRAHEFLIESVSSVVYHYTNLPAARKILTSGEFQLSSVLGSIEQKYAPRGYPYFLSTTRTRRGGYHDAGFDAYHGVLFELDGTWYNRYYPGGPVDYWGNRDPEQSHHRKHEAEDRIYSKDPAISAGGVRSVHVLATADAEPNHRAQARAVLIAAKKQNIPVYYYDDQSAWLNQDVRKTADVRQLTGQDPARGRISRHRGYLLPWVELIQAQDKTQLSKKADSIRYSLNFGYDQQSAAQGLGTDLSNARKPNSGADRENAVKIIRYMQQHRLNTVPELVDHLATKWTKQVD